MTYQFMNRVEHRQKLFDTVKRMVLNLVEKVKVSSCLVRNDSNLTFSSLSGCED